MSSTVVLIVRTRNESGNTAKSQSIYISNESTNQNLSVGLFSKMSSSNQTRFAVSGHLASGTASGASVLGTVGTASAANSLNHVGVFAGYFKGDVLSTGTIYGTLLSTYPTFPTPLTSLSANEGEEDAELYADRLSRLSVVSYEDDGTALYGGSNSVSSDSEEGGEGEEYAYTPNRKSTSDTRYAIALESLKELFPEFVYEDKEGNVSVDYVGMVPVLVQAIGELHSQVETLKGNHPQMAPSQSENGEATPAGFIDLESTRVVSLAQNSPNPFDFNTEIEVSLPESVNDAKLIVTDLNGKQLKKVNISERGAVKVTLNASDFYEGMFLYTLITDGKAAATKKMMIM